MYNTNSGCEKCNNKCLNCSLDPNNCNECADATRDPSINC